MSDGEIVESEDNIYYETSLDDRLKFIPKNTDPDVRFGGWYLNPDYFNLVEPVTSYTMPETDLTLYAKWVPIDCTVTFDTRGGTSVEPQTVPKGECAQLPTEPTRENYKFGGWYTSEGVRWNFDMQIAGNITLYALWEPIPVSEGYAIRHILRTDNSEIAVYNGQGLVGDTIAAQALNARSKDYVTDSYIVPETLTKSITLIQDGENEAVFYYDVAGLRDYTVSYFLEGTEEKLSDDKVVTGTALSRVTELAKEIEGYTPAKAYQVADLKEEGENRIIFYYTKDGGASLTVSKTVTGKLGDKEKAFSVEITLTDKSGTPISGSFSVSGDGYSQGDELTFDEGSATIYLKDSQSVTISGLNPGQEFQVQEVSVPAGYEVTYNGKSFENGIQGELEEQSEVAIVNHCEEIPITALDGEGKNGFVLLLSAGTLLAAAAGAALYKRRKHQ